jgi:hypothetical protein
MLGGWSEKNEEFKNSRRANIKVHLEKHTEFKYHDEQLNFLLKQYV